MISARISALIAKLIVHSKKITIFRYYTKIGIYVKINFNIVSTLAHIHFRLLDQVAYNDFSRNS